MSASFLCISPVYSTSGMYVRITLVVLSDSLQRNEPVDGLDVDAILVPAGDPAGEDEPIRKGMSFQQWLLGYEFPSTLLLFEKDSMHTLCSASKGSLLPFADDALTLSHSKVLVPDPKRRECIHLRYSKSKRSTF